MNKKTSTKAAPPAVEPDEVANERRSELLSNYMILQGDTADFLCGAVERECKSGWQPIGGVSVAYGKDMKNKYVERWFFYQAMGR